MISNYAPIPPEPSSYWKAPSKFSFTQPPEPMNKGWVNQLCLVGFWPQLFNKAVYKKMPNSFLFQPASNTRKLGIAWARSSPVDSHPYRAFQKNFDLVSFQTLLQDSKFRDTRAFQKNEPKNGLFLNFLKCPSFSSKIAVRRWKDLN